ncbi:MAG: ABC transporter substrate-binding protein [Anaerolineae bacterium]|nr:ABC transporter substrate-binding protein [Anaerolineae bacterium]
MKRSVLLVIALAFAALFFGAELPEAHACTPPVGGHPVYSIAHRVRQSDVVLEGTVKAVEGQSDFNQTAVVDVAQYLKGKGEPTVKISGFGTTALCLTPISVGQRAIFFAEQGSDGTLRAKHFSFADASVDATPAALSAVRAALQAGDPLGGATQFARTPVPTNVTIVLDWTPNTNYIGVYVARAKGYYAEANLNVTVQPAGDIAADQVVASGAAQFGFSYQEGLTYSRAAGVPVVSVAAIIQHNTSGFVSLSHKKPLKRPADLVGARYGSFGSPVIEQAVLGALIACDGASGGVEMRDIGFVEPFPLMERDQIDVVWIFYGWDGIRAEQRGLKLDMLMLKDFTNCVPDYYTPILTTSERMIAEQPEVVRAFVQATARGYADAIANPSEAARILLEAEPDLDADLVRASAIWLAEQFQAEAPQWGIQRAEVWQAFTDFMVKAGALESPIDSAKAFTNDFLPRAN